MVYVGNENTVKYRRHIWRRDFYTKQISKILTKGTEMNLQELAMKVVKREGKKKNIDIAQILEILKITGQQIAKDPQALICLLSAGCHKKKAKKKAPKPLYSGS